MTAEHVFILYRAYKFLYGSKNLKVDLEKFSGIQCPPLIEQKDRRFYYRIAQQLKDDTIHALFTIGFFFNPNAHVSNLATPEAFSQALGFASRGEGGTVVYEHSLYDLRKRMGEGGRSNTLQWLYGEPDSLMAPCIQELINGELDLDIAAMLLLIPQQELDYDWLLNMEAFGPDDMGLGPRPWVDRLVKADQLVRLQRPTWRLDARRLAKEFWHSLGFSSLAPAVAPQTESSLF